MFLTAHTGMVVTTQGYQKQRSVLCPGCRSWLHLVDLQLGGIQRVYTTFSTPRYLPIKPGARPGPAQAIHNPGLAVSAPPGDEKYPWFPRTCMLDITRAVLSKGSAGRQGCQPTRWREPSGMHGIASLGQPVPCRGTAVSRISKWLC